MKSPNSGVIGKLHLIRTVSLTSEVLCAFFIRWMNFPLFNLLSVLQEVRKFMASRNTFAAQIFHRPFERASETKLYTKWTLIGDTFSDPVPKRWVGSNTLQLSNTVRV